MITKFIIQYFFWFINVLLSPLRLLPRNKNIWLFGAWGGDSYSDNSKYLFEYVCNNLPYIKSVWITKSKEVKQSLVERNKECYLYNEKYGRKMRLKAKYVFFTNGITDFGPFDLCHGSTRIALWHGMPLKKLCFATNNIQKRNKNFYRYIQYLLLKIYDHTQRNITIATSTLTKSFLEQCFEVNPESIVITGQPRNDNLFNNNKTDDIRKDVGHKQGEKFILYMPTWRERQSNDFLIEQIITSLTDDNQFLKHLETNRIKLYVKPHPRSKIQSKSISNIRIIDNLFKYDTQSLISTSDILITDYSSIFIDYALLERPIHFFVPDIEKYKTDRLGLFLDFHEFAEYWIDDINILKECISNYEKYLTKGMANTLKINSIFNDPSLSKGNYSEKLISKLKQLGYIKL